MHIALQQALHDTSNDRSYHLSWVQFFFICTMEMIFGIFNKPKEGSVYTCTVFLFDQLYCTYNIHSNVRLKKDMQINIVCER